MLHLLTAANFRYADAIRKDSSVALLNIFPVYILMHNQP